MAADRLRAARAVWALNATAVVVVASCDGRDHVALVPASATAWARQQHRARGEGTLTFDALLGDDVAASPTGSATGRACSAPRCACAARSRLGWTLELTVRYAQGASSSVARSAVPGDIQHHLAVLASQTAVANAAADIALESLEPAIGLFNLGAAKVRAGEAASVGAALAHQVHGAIGFTLEYELNLSTRRLWSWRDEFGNEAEWSSSVGRRIAAAGSGALWATITSAGSANASAAAGTREEVRA
jgi:acyl-CoA dehydrogenase